MLEGVLDQVRDETSVELGVDAHGTALLGDVRLNRAPRLLHCGRAVYGHLARELADVVQHGVREERAVEVDAKSLLARPLHPRAKVLEGELIAVVPGILIRKDRVAGVQIDALGSGDEARRLLEVGRELGEVTGSAGIAPRGHDIGLALDDGLAEKDRVADGLVDVVIGHAKRHAAKVLVDKEIGALEVGELDHLQSAIDAAPPLVSDDASAAQGVHPLGNGDDLLAGTAEAYVNGREHLWPGHDERTSP